MYLMQCADNSLYCGVTTDIERRLRQHNGELKGGARYTQTRRPVRVVYQEDGYDRSSAAKREYVIKKLSPAAKKALFRSSNIPRN
ncbi:GIY-YIG nuclease family protein [Idiomarina sp.]|uniref:GIY-YIG nuclease family protein n=1 Tax=Idiomarina sp. TaxID=1874361 RepID=UPI0025B86161|nr:GIY-YIG nuclease family protein [Idiomarina sp.]